MKAIFSAFVALSGLATPVLAEFKWDNQSGGHVRIYGQVSPVYQSVDDGVGSTSGLVDNSHSNTRVGLWVVQPMTSGTFRFNLETALGLRGSGGVSQTSKPDPVNWERTDIRKVEVIFEGDSWGTLSVGQGSMATDGVADKSLNNNAMTTYNGIGDFAGSFEFRTSAGDLSGVSISSVTPSLDGGRQGRIRYDTPSFNGFTVSVAAGTDILSEDNDDEFYDAALRFQRDFGSSEIAAGVGFSRRDSDGVDRDDTFGSVAMRFDNGFNFAAAAGSREDSGDYTYFLAGYEVDIWSVGRTSFAVDYYAGRDFGLDGRDSDVIGIGINQNFDDQNAQVYLGYRTHELSDPSESYKDVDAFLFGARWRF